MPIWIATICPATTKAWKNNCSDNPSSAPMMICSAISSRPLKSSGLTVGNGGRLGMIARVMANDRNSLMRLGTRVVPMIGMVVSSAPTRNSGSIKLATQVLICASVRASSDI